MPEVWSLGKDLGIFWGTFVRIRCPYFLLLEHEAIPTEAWL